MRTLVYDLGEVTHLQQVTVRDYIRKKLSGADDSLQQLIAASL